MDIKMYLETPVVFINLHFGILITFSGGKKLLCKTIYA